MRYDPHAPQNPENDRFVLSKGHAAPILYAAWAEAGLFPREELLELRKIDSDLEGHPTPRLSFVDVATGSLGQGICAGIGIALNARRIKSDYRTYVLLGDGEMAEGSVWEAATWRCTTSSTTYAGSSTSTASARATRPNSEHDMDALAAAGSAFGWHTIVVDGHDMQALQAALERPRDDHRQPTMILARTLKGKGVAFDRREGGWHGKALKKGEETDDAIAELEAQFMAGAPSRAIREARGLAPAGGAGHAKLPAPDYKLGDRWRRVKRGASRSLRSAAWTNGSSRSMPTSRTRPSATSSRRRTRIASSRVLSRNR